MRLPERSVFCIGDLPPAGYIDRQEWARVQIRGGLKQQQCSGCNLWLFPQERDAHKCDQRRRFCGD